MRDLVGGTLLYAKSNLEGGTIPVQEAIDEGRALLQEAKQRISYLGQDLRSQIKDSTLRSITFGLYSRIPKIKPRNTSESDWILSQDNIYGWEQDLNAFETALQSGDVSSLQNDPLQDMPFWMEWVSPQSDVGEWLHHWWPSATRNKHSAYGKMLIKNLWKIERKCDDQAFDQTLNSVSKDCSSVQERPLFQDKKRPDLDIETRKRYWNTNVAMLFHGTRSVNVAGILQKHFQIPQYLKGVHITAAMLGDQGTYLSDDWKKSAGYTSLQKSFYAKGGGSIPNRQAFMLVCDAILGNMFVAPKAQPFKEPPTGYHSIFGKGGHTSTGGGKALMNNEYVVVPKQIKQKYLVEFCA